MVVDKCGIRKADAADQMFSDQEGLDQFARHRGNPNDHPTVGQDVANKYNGLKNWITAVGKEFSQTVRGLDRTPENAEFEQLLLRRAEGDLIARNKSHILISQSLRGLSQDEQFTFDAWAYNQNMLHDIQKQKDRWVDAGNDMLDFKARLPEGWTEASAEATRTKMEDFLNNKAKNHGIDAQKITDTWSKIVEYRKDVINEFQDLNFEVTGVKLDLDPSNYLRHQMMLNAETGGPVKAGAHVKANPRASYLRAQMGSEMAYNTSFVESELDWLPNMIKQTLDLKILKHVNDTYNINKELSLASAEMNTDEMKGFLDAHSTGKAIPPGAQLDVLGKLAAEERLPDRLDNKFQTVITALGDRHEGNIQLKSQQKAPLPLSPEMEKELKGYAEWLLSEEKGKVRVKNVANNPIWMKQNGYKEFQAIEGNHFFKVMTVPEQLMDLANQVILTQSTKDLRPALAMGRKRRTMVVPNHIHKILSDYTGVGQELGPVGELFSTVTKLWKLDKLFGPAHTASYGIGNILSDNDATLRGNPHTAMVMKEGGEDLWRLYIGQTASDDLKKKLSPEKQAELARREKDLMGWVDRGGLATSFVTTEGVGAGGKLDLLKKVRPNPVPMTISKGAQTVVNWAAAGHEARENLYRYSTYLSYLQRMRENGGVPPNYGASHVEIIDALPTLEDKAWKLSNDLLGAYNERSLMAQRLRGSVFPFISFMEIHARREVSFIRNAINAPHVAENLGKTLSQGKLQGVRAMALGRWLGGAIAASVAMEALNMLRYGVNYREKLPEEYRNSAVPLVIYNYDADTDSYSYINRPSNFAELLNWVNLNQGYNYYQKFIDRQMTGPEIVQDMLIATPAKKLAASLGFPYKLPYALATGIATGQDFTKPFPVRDKAEAFFREWSLDKAYRSIHGLPMPEPTKVAGMKGRTPSWLGPLAGLDTAKMFTAANKLDLRQENYHDMLEHASQWKSKQVGGGRFSFSQDDKSQAAYNMKLSMRYNDMDSADKFLWDYKHAGGTDETMKAALMRLEPLSGLSEGEKAKYVESLNPENAERLRRAYMHWGDLVTKGGIPPLWESIQPLALPYAIAETKKQVGKSLDYFWVKEERIERGRGISPMVLKIQSMPNRDQYLASKSGKDEQVIRNEYRRLAGRVSPKEKIDVPDSLGLVEWVAQMEAKIQKAGIDVHQKFKTEKERTLDDIVPPKEKGR